MPLPSAGAAFRQAVKEESPLQVVGAINANGSVVLQGVSIGLEGRW